MGVFDSRRADVFATYRGRIEFRDKLMAGIPGDPKLMAGWIRGKAGIKDQEEVRQMLLRTMIEVGEEIDLNASFEEIMVASEKMALTRQTCVFKRDENGLYLESRCLKACLKENTNIHFEGEGWLKRAHKNDASKTTNGKNPKSVVAERVFITPDRLYFGLSEPSNVYLFIGHVPEKPGSPNKRSTLNHHEYVENAAFDFEVMVAGDIVTEDQWATIWLSAQENGLGTLRSQGFGRFEITLWERVG